jgi:ABC-type iron transport system FetAB ATPase subunit
MPTEDNQYFENPFFSYCAQIPAMHSGTVKENILMGSKYDEKRY